MSDNFANINDGIARYVGFGSSRSPHFSKERLIEKYGAEESNVILPKIIEVYSDIDDLRPDWSNHSLVSAGSWAKSEIIKKHPWLDSNALDALIWHFTWRWR